MTTDKLTRYAQAIPYRNQSANATKKALFENLALHYSFLSKIYCDIGANFEFKVTRKMCFISSINKTRTTYYHPIEDGMMERFNKTLLNIMATLPGTKQRKVIGKPMCDTHTKLQCAVNDGTGILSLYFMLSRQPRLAVYSFLGHFFKQYCSSKQARL